MLCAWFVIWVFDVSLLHGCMYIVVPHMWLGLSSLWLSAYAQWPVFNAHAARELL